MNTPHIHCELIIEWAKGCQIQRYNKALVDWINEPYPSWYPGDQYRIKPERYEAWVNVYSVDSVGESFVSQKEALESRYSGCIRTVHVREVE